MCVGVCASVCASVFSPINSFVVVICVEELDLLVCLWTGEVTGYGGMHEQEEIKSCRPWKKRHNS